MGKQNYTLEQIIVKLRSIEILCNQGKTVAEAVRQEEISEQTYYTWRKKYGGMNVSDAKKLRELEKENARLKKLVAELLDSFRINRSLSMKGCPYDNAVAESTF